MEIEVLLTLEGPRKIVSSSRNTDDDAEEKHFRRLYDQVLDYFLKGTDISDMNKMHRAISFIKKSFLIQGGRSRFSDIDFERQDMVCGYIFRYGPHGAGLTRCRTLDALEKCPILRSLLKAPRLKVASLGCGPGNDAVGFCSALSRCQFSGSLDMYVVDAASLWKDSINVAAKLLKQGGFGHASDLFQREKVKLFFRALLLPKELCELPMDEIDVFLICKLVSIMDKNDRIVFVQNLCMLMKESALILLIDTRFEEEKLWHDKFEVLYLSDANQYYELATTVERFGHDDCVTTKSRIAVLKKKRRAGPMSLH